jgi:hypothetical protein
VLRSGGHVLFADVGPKPYIDTLRGHVGQCGLSIEEEEDITPDVSRTLRITSPSGYGRSSATLPALRTRRCLQPAAQENGCISALCSKSHKSKVFRPGEVFTSQCPQPSR